MVTRFVNILEAQAARFALQEHGIWSYLSGENLQIDGVRLFARKNDLDEIVRILELETDDEDEGWRCPECGSWEVDVPVWGRRRRCESCGHQWSL